MVARGQRVVLAVYGQPHQAPLNEVQRGHYCTFLKHALKRIPKIRDVVVWNEVNSPQFWPTAGGPTAYEALLAECWDRLRRLRPYVNLISSTAARHDPAGFMRAVGVAYRQRGRRRPIISTFGHNPYPLNAAEPPRVRHDDRANVSQADCRDCSWRSTRPSTAPASRCRARPGRRSGTWRTGSRRPSRPVSAVTTTARRPTTGRCPRSHRKGSTRGTGTRRAN
jgi:hypothetical protein